MVQTFTREGSYMSRRLHMSQLSTTMMCTTDLCTIWQRSGPSYLLMSIFLSARWCLPSILGRKMCTLLPITILKCMSCSLLIICHMGCIHDYNWPLRPPLGSVNLVSTKFTNLVSLEQLLQLHKVCDIAVDELHRPAMVALKRCKVIAGSISSRWL